MRIYGDKRSGNCYKIQLLLALLSKTYDWTEVDIQNGDTRNATFLDKNPNGKIPVLELEDGKLIWESNAILWYIAQSSTFIPPNAFDQAQMLKWQFFEQYSHEPYIAVARYIWLYLGLPDEKRAEFEAKQEGGHKALQVMESQLTQTPFLVGSNFTLADISLFAYTHVAHEGGFDLTPYPAIQTWITRIKDYKNFVPMQA